MTQALSNGSTLRIVQEKDTNLCSLFTPAGPGLESPYLHKFIQSLRLPGNVAVMDFPRSTSANVEGWKIDLMQAIRLFPRCVLIGHSFGGMLAMSIPEVEKELAGAILLNCSLDGAWQSRIAEERQRQPVPEIDAAESEFRNAPSDQSLKRLCLALASYYFTDAGRDAGKKMLENTTYNSWAFLVALEHFFPVYRCAWKDWSFPTLCLFGDSDPVSPSSSFLNDPNFAERSNVILTVVPQAAHFPWVDNPAVVQNVFQQFCSLFS